MPQRRILSVDTAFDATLRKFARDRQQYYETQVGSVYEIRQLGEHNANRENLLKLCERRLDPSDDLSPVYFDALVVSSHGLEGLVQDNEDSPEGILFSVADSDEVLGTIAKDRTVYLCCCRTANSQLPQRMMAAGACLFAGFKDSPQYDSDDGGRFWKDIDLAFVDCAIRNRKASAYKRLREDFLERVEDDRPFAQSLPLYLHDLDGIEKTLGNMVILER